MNLSTRRALALAAAAATAAAGTLVWAPAAQADHSRPSTTDYGFAGGAFGSRARVGEAGVGSGHTAFSYFGCTRRAGVHRDNHLVEAGVEGVLSVTGVRNHTESYQTRRRVGSRAHSVVAEAVLGDPQGLHLAVKGLRTQTNAFASRRSGKFGARSVFTAAEITGNTGNEELDEALNGSLGDLLGEVSDQIQQQGGGPLVLPGLGEIGLGVKRNRIRATSATAHASALQVRLYAEDGTRNDNDVNVVLGKSRSVILEDLPAGIMRGKAVPAQARLLDGTVDIGRISDVPLPCQGTRGKVKRDATASVDPLQTGQLVVSGLEGTAYGVQRDRGSARAWTRAEVAGLDLGKGQLRIGAVVGKANVQTNRRGAIVARNTRGSSIGAITAGGKSYPVPPPGEVLEIPGVAEIRAMVTERTKRGLTVTALHVTLLEGTDTVVQLGKASAFIKKY